MNDRRRPSDLGRLAVGAAVVVITGAMAADGEVGSTETKVFHHVNGLPDVHPGVLWPQQQLGNLAVGPIIVGIAAARRQWHLAAAAATATGLKLGLERAVKAVVVRERPGTTVPGAVRRGDVPHQGQSFVSGHATMVTALATVVTPHLAPRWKPLPAVAAALVCFARVYSGAHNPLDIVGGVGLGCVAGGDDQPGPRGPDDAPLKRRERGPLARDGGRPTARHRPEVQPQGRGTSLAPSSRRSCRRPSPGRAGAVVAMKSRSTSTNRSGASDCGKWRTPSKISRRLPGIASWAS